MFYSQIILAKQGPLAKVWLAAHWGDQKLGRPQIFATDIGTSVDHIVHPAVPLALRVSGHLLLGVVRIYSRKVKYVLHDCTEAMVKLQLAFTNNASSSSSNAVDLYNTKGSTANTGSGREGTAVAANFGEFDPVHIVEGFGLPVLQEANEWILAEPEEDANVDDWGNDNENVDNSNNVGGSNFNDLSATTMQESTFDQGEMSLMYPEEEEQEEVWAPFDPEEEDAIPGAGSRVSDVEVVRAGEESLDAVRRGSSLLGTSLADSAAATATADETATEEKQHDEGEDTTTGFQVATSDEEPDQVPPLNDDDEGDGVVPVTPGGLSFGDDVAVVPDVGAGIDTPASANLSIGGLEGDTPDAKGDADDNDNQRKRAASPSPSPSPSPTPRRRRRKRRKIVIDNESTELSNNHIKQMLADTSDLCQLQRHPAYEYEEDEDEDMAEDGDIGTNDLATTQTWENRISRPFGADDGQLAPALSELWNNNFYRALSRPRPFETRQGTPDAPQGDEGSIEQARQEVEQEDGGADPAAAALVGDEEQPEPMEPGEGDQIPQDDNLEFPTIEQEDDDVVPMSEDEGEEGTQAQQAAAAATDKPKIEDEGDGPRISLGWTNVLDDVYNKAGSGDGEEDQRQILGQEESSSTKWHPHTVRVMELLQRNLATGNEDDDDNKEGKSESLSYHSLSNKCSRRTAAGVFLELLQLKTWDFVELEQDEAFGDITISAGVRFSEGPPPQQRSTQHT